MNPSPVTASGRAENPIKKSLRRIALICLTLLPTLGIFSVSLNHGFVNWDDGPYIYNNPLIKTLSVDHVVKMFKGEQSPTWHPLAWLSHALDYKLYQLNPMGHHLTNLILHGLVTLCVFFLFVALLRLGSSKPMRESTVLTAAALAALLFGIHPLRVESVVWLSERKGLLAVFFVLAALLAYLRHGVSAAGKSRRIWYASALFFFILALMSKPTVVAFPLVLLLLDVYPLNRFSRGEPRRKLWLEKVPFLALSLMVGIVELRGEYQWGTIISVQTMGLGERLHNVAGNLVFFIEKTFLPIRLTPFYPLPDGPAVFSASLAGSLATIAGITGFCLWTWKRRRRFWLIAWLYYLAAALPVIGIIHSGNHLTADRYSYFPTLSFYMLACAGVAWTLESRVLERCGQAVRTGFLLSIVAVIVLLGGLSLHQIKIWSGPRTFWQHVTAVYPQRIGIAHNNLGNALMDEGLLDDAKREYQTAVRINPAAPKPYANLGLVYLASKQLDKAEAESRKALELAPRNLTANNNMGLIYLERGRLKKAEATFKAILKIRPNYVEGHNNLGVVYEKLGLIEQAIAEFETAYKINPDFGQAAVNLIQIYGKKSLAVRETVRENK